MFELIIALGIGVVIVTAIVQLVTVSVRNASFAKDKTEATRYAQQALEWFRSQKEQDWASFYSQRSGSPAYWCLPALSWDAPSVRAQCTSQTITNTNFKRQAELTQSLIDADGNGTLDTNIVVAAVTVSWDEGGKTHTSRATTQFGQTN